MKRQQVFQAVGSFTIVLSIVILIFINTNSDGAMSTLRALLYCVPFFVAFVQVRIWANTHRRAIGLELQARQRELELGMGQRPSQSSIFTVHNDIPPAYDSVVKPETFIDHHRPSSSDPQPSPPSDEVPPPDYADPVVLKPERLPRTSAQ
ncbi:unnamed protein product [Cyprideis torosa]|uniref:Uncharacterized protein n=1 Tax=Cyprideis torosa TaxID=163714 RepID=A0A7R8WMA4_9CRUS|nr:unnamed protein product [Cyprideis torosa]CAG0902546.1 unnamed protein product [Cyprideis torosa]